MHWNILLPFDAHDEPRQLPPLWHRTPYIAA